MRPLNVLLVLVSLLIIGGAALLVLGKDAPKPTAAIASGPAEPSGQAPRTEGELQTPARASKSTGQARPERVAQAEPEPEPETVLGSPTSPVLRGRVVDALGNPLAGATVHAAGGSGFSLPLDTTGLEDTRWFKRSTTETDARGVFELTGPKPGLLRLAVRAPGFAPFDKDEIPLPAEPVHELTDIVMEPGVVLSGRVVDSLGRGVAGASLWKVSDSGPGFFFRVGGSRSGVLLAETGANGEFRIDQMASGPWKVRTTTEDHPDALAEGVSERPGQVQSGLVIRLEDGYEIRGRLTGAPAETASELSVRATPARGDEGGWGMLVDAELGGGESRQAAVATDGSFAVRGLKRDQRYRLQARRPGTDFSSSTQSQAVTATAGDGGIEIVWQPEAVLVFQVVDALTREPLTRFDVSAGTQWALPLMDPDKRPIREHADGLVRFGNLRPKSDGERAKLEISAVGYADFEQDDIVIRVGQETDLGVIALEHVPVVNVTVRERKTGAAIEGAQVTLAAEEKRSRGGAFVMRRTIEIEDEDGGDVIIQGDGHRGRSDENGLAKVNAFDGQSQRLTVNHPGFAAFRGEPFEVPAGESVDREVLLGPGGTVRVTLLAPDGSALAGGRVDHRPSGGEGLPTFPRGADNVTDGDGQVSFEHLEPGTHAFRAGGSGGGWSGMMGANLVIGDASGGQDDAGWTEVEVLEDATAEVTVTAPLKLQLTGRVREGGKNLAGATVRLEPRGEDDDPMGHMRMLGGGGPSAKTDGQGGYVLENVEAGPYTLTVEHASRLMPTDFPVDMYDTDRVFDVELSVAIIEGRIADQAGEPLAGLKVWAERARAESAPGRRTVSFFVQADGGGNSVMFGSDSSGKVENRTDADGRYSLRGVQTDLELQIVAEGKGVQKGRSETVEVAPDEVLRGVDLTLEAAGEIEVVARKADGSPAGSLIVTARFEGESGDDEPESKTGFIAGEGKTRLRGLAPGAWRVTLRGMGFGGSSAEGIPDQVIEVAVGKTATATFTVP